LELAIDTSTATAGIALGHRGKVLTEVAWQAGHNHTVELHPTVERVLALNRTAISSVDAIIVAIGPGTFSGLRVGVSAAKGFAIALGVPIVAVGTLAAAAYPFAVAGLPIRPILNAGRGELAVGHFQAKGGGMEEREPPTITDLDGLCESVVETTMFCGEHLPQVAEELTARLGDLARIPPASALLRRPGHLVELGWLRLAAGDSDDAATLQPVYLRAPSITRPRPARAASR
jgi:tRNA threonylcarbamoyladenosine biosynthesis protein TsaB